MITAEKAMREFAERYPSEAIAAISEMAQDKTLFCVPFKTVSFKESNESFKEFLEGYVDYQCDKDHQEKPLLEILDSAKKYVGGLFKESETTYDKTPDFVGYYIEQMLELEKLANQSIGTLMDHEVGNEAVGLVSEMVSAYVEAATAAVNPIIDKMVLASGYRCERSTSKESPKQPSFII